MENQIEKTETIVKRESNLINLIKKPWLWTFIILVLILILGVYIRVQPMLKHGTNPGLWDITTNNWTLGPDLDPWLFYRYAKYIISDNLPAIDTLRNVPVGFDISKESILLSYMIAWTYNIFKLFFPGMNIELAAVIFPVIMFILTSIAFFLFVREIFIRKERKVKANIIALISTLIMTLLPNFLPRTIAGIPEKESAAFCFLFLAFYFFLKSWKSEKIPKAIIFSILAGISTAVLGMLWGGVLYAFIIIALATLIAFLLNKVHKKEFITYLLWVIVSLSVLLFFSNRLILTDIIYSLDTGFVSFVFAILVIHFAFWNIIKKQTKIPKNILSIIIAILLLVIASSVILGPFFIIDKIAEINKILLTPTTGRWQTTVAENRQPYYSEWASMLGPVVKNIALSFLLFFVGSVLLFKNMFNQLKKKDKWILTGLYVFFFLGVVFSRYAPHPAILDGEGIISRLFYYGSAVLLFGFMIRTYLKYHKEKENTFDETPFEFILTFALLVLGLVTARSAIRLVMVINVVSSVFIGYLVVELTDLFRKSKTANSKLITGSLVILVVFLSIFTAYTFYKETKSSAFSYVPSYYNQQWQKAMSWVRTETPTNSVFASWWDYGYWLQSIGNRATVTDGGNAITFWNYYMGRLVLTGDNRTSMMDFLYSHNTTNLLIDSSDIGKYGAYSSIGSDLNYDRFSWINLFLMDNKQTVETKNQTVFVYNGGASLDEDIVINENGKEKFLPAQVAGLGAIALPIFTENGSFTFEQPSGIFVYQGKQYKQNIRYAYYRGQLFDFEKGIEATVYVMPQIVSGDEGLTQNNIGTIMYISPRVMRGLFARLYLLNNSLGDLPNFELVHSEPNLIVNELNNQGANLPEFIYYNGIHGPIKIWHIKYSGTEQFKQEYLDRDYSKYISWKL